MIPTRFVPALLAAWVALLPVSVRAATPVAGNLNVDTTWTVAGSPYQLTGDVTVAPHVTLTIEPGVTLTVDSTDQVGAGEDAARVELIVLGALHAVGTEQAPIAFTSDDWRGITFAVGARESWLQHAQLQSASHAVTVRSLSPVHLAHLAVDGTDQGITWESSVGATLEDISLEHVASVGLWLRDGGASGVNLELVDCRIVFGGVTGIDVGPRVSATLRGCEVREFDGAGLALADGSTAAVTASQFIFNRTGILAPAGSALDLTNSVIAGNQEVGLDLTQAPGKAFQVLNNTLDRNRADPFDNKGDGTSLKSAVAEAQSFIVRNNHVTNGGGGIAVTGVEPSLAYNNVWGHASNYVNATAGTGSISVNPLYRKPLALTGDWVPHAFWASVHDDLYESEVTAPPGTGKIRFDVSGSCYTSVAGYYVRFYDDRSTLWNQFVCDSTPSGSAEVPGSYVDILGRGRSDGSYQYRFTISNTQYKAYDDRWDYRLTATSPTLDLGDAWLAPATDADGQARPYDGDLDGLAAVDIGAYEWRENVAPVVQGLEYRLVRPLAEASFDATGSRDVDGTIASYAWDFGDGATAAGPTATHVWSSPGTYTVTLTLTDNLGASTTAVATVDVVENLPPVAVAGEDREVEPEVAVQFDGSASTDLDGSVVTVIWDFGDGSESRDLAPLHTFATSGIYPVTLTVIDDDGAVGTDQVLVTVTPYPLGDIPPSAVAGPGRIGFVGFALTFDGTASSDRDGPVVDYAWDFGDGTTANGATVQHTYEAPGSYPVTLTVTDEVGQTDSDVTLVVIEYYETAAPTAEAGGPYGAEVGVAVQFDGTGSSDTDGFVTAFTWDFGDGTTGTGPQPTHAYAAPGNYLVTLRVTDDKGASDDDVGFVTISALGAGNAAPVAEAGAYQQVTQGDPVTLSATASSDADGTLVSWAWDFGDGSLASGETVLHTYAEAGAYLVTLEVTDDRGATAQDHTLVNVTLAPNAAPVTDAGTGYTAEPGVAIQFDGTGSSDPDGSIASYFWDFGDGETSTEAQPAHAFQAPGNYLVRLVVTDDRGATTEASVLVAVASPGNALPSARAGGTYRTTVDGTVAFDGTASADPDGSIASYQWEFGDGETGTGAQATHRYVDPGSYLVRLTVTDDRGAIAQDVALVVVSEAVEAGGCASAGGPAGMAPLGLLALGLLFTRRRR